MATYTTSPELGVNLALHASAGASAGGFQFKALTRCADSLGKSRIVAKASEALTSTDTIKIGTSGSASSDSGSAGWRVGGNGAVVTGQLFWAEKVTF